MKKISILIPCYNEELSLDSLYKELKVMISQTSCYEWEIVFVNDGSKDGTLEKLQELHRKDSICNYLDLSRNFGKEAAMLAGFDYVTGDAMVVMDADLQHPPYVIPQMIKKWEQGFDDVYARRLTRGKESFFRKRISLLYYKILNKSTRIDVLPNVGDFRLLDKKCIESLKSIREQCRYTKGMFCYIGYKKAYVDFETRDRVAGESSMNYRTLFNLAIEGLLSYTTAPLRVASVAGIVISVLSFIYGLWVIVKTLIWGELVAGYPTLILTLLFLGGLILFCLGIIGEYVGRIYVETKNRPVYFVQSYNGSLK